MAIAFMRVRPLSRGNGQSAVACAAYRACVKLHDAFYDKDHDYSKKSGHIAGGLEVICTGSFRDVDVGETISAEGEYVNHQVYGRQFKVVSYRVVALVARCQHRGR